MLGFRAAPDAKYWHRLWSVRFLIIGAAFNGVASVVWALGYLPWMESHPMTLMLVGAGVNVAALTARLVDQENVPNS